jgi:glucose-6-phosphate isomerase
MAHTAPVVFGEPGTDGQHAFYQLLHQGYCRISADFIGVIEPNDPLPGHHRVLTANLLAQSQALMTGRTEDEARDRLLAGGKSEEDAARLAPHTAFDGDRPSNTILLDRLDPRLLGMLIALYEHKVFVQGVIWGIDSFDQFGVELGKTLAGAIEPELGCEALSGTHDSSTRGLIDYVKQRTGGVK